MAAFDGMQGTYVRRDASGLYFMSKKGIWKPMRSASSFDLGALTVGHKYGLEMQNRELVNAVDLGPNTFFQQNLAEHEGGGAPTASSFQSLQPPKVQAITPGVSAGVPLNGLMASATGIAKSMIESDSRPDIEMRVSAHEAMIAGLRWARLWGDLPPRAEELLKGTDQVASLQKAAGMDGPQDRPTFAQPDPNDEVPF